MAKKNTTNTTTNTHTKTVKKSISAKTTASNPTDWSYYIPMLVAVLLAFIGFSPVFSADFVNWDDAYNVYENKFMTPFGWENVKGIFTHNIFGGYNPLSILSFSIEWAIFGRENLPQAIHTNNLILHLFVTYFAFRIVNEMGLSRFVVFFVTVLFAIHPMRVESVAWATERKDVLFGTFYFAAILQYIKYLKSDQLLKKHLYYAMILFVFALFSKVQAVSLPLSLLAIDYWQNRKIAWKLLFEKWFFFLGSFLMGLATFLLLKQAKTINDTVVSYNFLERICVATYTYGVYAVKFVYPYIMSAIYPYPAELTVWFYIAPILWLISFIVGIWAYRRGWKYVAFGLWFFFVNYIFVSQIVGAGQGYLADRFTYVAYWGWWVLVAVGLERLLKNREHLLRYATYVYIGLCVILTYLQTQTWENGEQLWTQALRYEPRSAFAMGNRGSYFRDKKMYDKALADFDSAIAIKPRAGTYNSRAKLYFDLGQSEKAIADCDSGLKLDSTTLAELWINRAAATGKLNRLDETLYAATKGLAIDSLNEKGYMYRSYVYGVRGMYQEAISDNKKFLALSPNTDENIWFETALFLWQLQQPTEANSYFAEALKRHPEREAMYRQQAQAFLK